MSTVINHSATTDGEAKGHALVAYVLLLIGLFTVIPMLFGGIWAMVKRKSAIGTQYYSHYTNAIRIFWWTLAWSVLGWILVFVFIGYAVLGLVWLWALYRLINGLVKILANEPYPV